MTIIEEEVNVETKEIPFDKNAFTGRFLAWEPGETKKVKLEFVTQFKELNRFDKDNPKIMDGLKFKVIEIDGKQVTDKELKTTSKRLCFELSTFIEKYNKQPFTVMITRSKESGTKTRYTVVEV